MHNLSTVMKFEIVRTLKKKSFWLMALLFPVAIILVYTIIVFAGKATDQAAKDAQNEKFSIEIMDDSKLLQPAIIKAFHAKVVHDKSAGIDDVKQGKVDTFFYYPTDITKGKVKVYGKDVGLFDNNRYQTVADGMLRASATASVGQSLTTILSGKVGYDATTYKDGEVYDGFSQVLAPGVFLVLFYILIAMFGNQMLTSTTEEKENRVIEMLLTTVRARTLILGKILSLIILGFIQVAVILIPLIIGYLLFHDRMSLPGLDLSQIPFDWLRIGVGAVIFMAGFLLFTGLLVTIGAATPTAKEAGGFFGIVMILIFGPLYAASLFVSSPHAGIVQFLSYFPFTAPIPLLLRNAVGNLTLPEAGLAIVILLVTGIIMLNVAVRVFGYGALEYSRRLSLKEIFRRKA